MQIDFSRFFRFDSPAGSVQFSTWGTGRAGRFWRMRTEIMNMQNQDFDTKILDDSAAIALLGKAYALLGDVLNAEDDDVAACAVAARSAIHTALSHCETTSKEDAELQIEAIRYKSESVLELKDRDAALKANRDVDRLCERLSEYISRQPVPA
jgi:hypothetical protein